MPGWTIIAADSDTGHIEAIQQSRWFRFTDDIVIRVSGDVAGNRIDMRSTSRQGHSDYETHCVAGVVRLELRNLSGPNPFELPREFCPIWLKALFRDGSSMSCAFASLQLRQALGQILSIRRTELNHVLRIH